MNYIYLHGFCSGENSYKGTMIKNKFVKKGYNLLTPDLNGGNFEHLTLSSQLEIIRKIAGELDGDITMLGSSMGAYLSALFAEEEAQVKQLVLLAPAFRFGERYLKRLDKVQLAVWKTTGYIEVYHHAYQENRKLHYGILTDAEKYDKIPFSRQLPVLIIHGLNDEAVDYRYSIEYLQQHPQAQLLLLNADHKLTNEIEAIWSHIERFLQL